MKRPPRDLHAPTFPFEPIRHLGPLTPGTSVRLGRREFDQLRAREVNVKEAFTLLDATGGAFRAQLRSLNPHGCDADIYEGPAPDPESPLRITLVVAFLARQRMLWVCQKATELGVTRIAPVFTEYSLGPEALAHEKAHAWQAQAVRAARQSRRAVLPEVRPAVPLDEGVSDPAWQGADLRLYLDDRGAEPGSPRLERGPTSACLAIGPEGGWAATERERLQAAGAVPWAVGGRVLRAETALLVGLTVLQYELGDLRS